MSASYELTIGDVLRELRTFYDYRQKDISDYLNITSQAYSNYENNKRTPDVDTLRLIASFYNISLDNLLNCRTTGLIQEAGSFSAKTKVVHGVTESGTNIPLNAREAKLVTDILSLSREQQDVCQKIIDFMKKD